ncbi:MAG TPA: DUF2225 domain-containing protein [Nitrospiria bacterium]|nr:DUF2225 domain-containing protein [Nitrospiria bacterium]
MVKPRRWVWLVVLLIFIGGLAAAEDTEVEVTCPLDGTKFKTPVDPSGARLGMRLDLKPIGFFKVPRRIPVCPTNHFVVYKKDFTADEKERLQKFVLSQDYQNLAKDNTPYFLLAKTFEYMGNTEWNISNTYLEASWEVENQPEKEKQYLDLSLQHFQKYLAAGKKEGDRTWETAQLLAGELARRLGRFDEAKAKFTELGALPEFKQGIYPEIIKYQMDLIAGKDSSAHDIPEHKK